jgi:3-oxo-5-alpha-steroid 4-dehydrogenase 1
MDGQFSIADVNRWSSYVLLISASFMLISTTLIHVPYGRYSAAKGWGFLLNCKIAWFLMESPNLWVSSLVYLASLAIPVSSRPFVPGSMPNTILLSLFVAHYINRSLIFPLKMCEGNPMPVSVMLSAFVFCMWNSFNQATYLLLIHRYDDNWIHDIRFLIGIALFIYGFYVNNRSDNILISLRKRKVESSAGGEKHQYFIPTGGMFEFVSCANYCMSTA